MSTADYVVTKSCENLLMWAVPCFLMVSGSLLLNPKKEIPLKKLFGKYIKRMLVALLIFTFVFQLFDVIMTDQPFSFKNVIGIWLWNFLTSRSWAHMWYLYMMIAMYLLVPIYKGIINSCSEQVLKYFIIVYIIFVSILPVTNLMGFELGFYIPVTLIYPVYMFLGYMIHNGILKIEKSIAITLTVCCSLAIIALACGRWLILTNLMDDMALESFDDFFFGYASILVVGQTIGIFRLFDGMKLKESMQDAPWIVSIDKCSFGIYLIHMMFVRLVMKHWLVNPYDFGGPLLFIMMTIVFFAVSYGIVWLLRKIPKVDSVL